MSRFRLLVPLLLLSLTSAWSHEGHGETFAQVLAPRMWAELGGRTYVGTYLSTTLTHISIRTAEGQTIQLERAKLSNADLAYLNTATNQTAQPATTTPVAPSSPITPRGTTPAPASRGTGGSSVAPPPAAANATARNTMLAGYVGGAPFFSSSWPTDAGVNAEPAIRIVEENEAKRRFIYESPHFRFESNVILRTGLLAKVAMMFEACYETHKAVPLNNRRTRATQAPKLKARLCETYADYLAAGGVTGSAGIYYGDRDEFIVPLAMIGVKKMASGYMYDYDGNSHTIYHEITHLLWADIGNCAGIWMTEGFAEYIACAPYRAGRFNFSNYSRAVLEYATGTALDGSGGRDLGKNIVMPRLSRFMTMSQGEFYQNGNHNYGCGMLLVYYFLQHDDDGARFRACIKACQDGKSAQEARQLLLGTRSYEQLEKEFAAALAPKGIKLTFQ